MIKPRWYRYISLPTLKWSKSLVAAFTVAQRISGRDYEEAEKASVYKTPKHGYVVRVINDDVTAIAWAAFVQAYVTQTNEGYGEVLHRLPKGSRRVFPRSTK